MAQVVKHLSSKHKALSSNPNTTEKRKMSWVWAQECGSV
jgi:hypothetical protein